MFYEKTNIVAADGWQLCTACKLTMAVGDSNAARLDLGGGTRARAETDCKCLTQSSRLFDKVKPLFFSYTILEISTGAQDQRWHRGMCPPIFWENSSSVSPIYSIILAVQVNVCPPMIYTFLCPWSTEYIKEFLMKMFPPHQITWEESQISFLGEKIFLRIIHSIFDRELAKQVL